MHEYLLIYTLKANMKEELQKCVPEDNASSKSLAHASRATTHLTDSAVTSTCRKQTLLPSDGLKLLNSGKNQRIILITRTRNSTAQEYNGQTRLQDTKYGSTWN